MGIFDRFNRNDASRGRTFDGQRVPPSEDEQALARYRYMLKTAPPETIEQAHAEAFAKLTPQQRRMLLEQLQAEIPEADRRYATDDPQALARLATRAEVRQPGVLERTFSRVPAAGGTGFGGILAGSLLGSVAGTVLGSMIAQNFLGSHGMGQGDQAQGVSGGDEGQDAVQTAHDSGADTGDIGSDFDGSIEI